MEPCTWKMFLENVSAWRMMEHGKKYVEPGAGGEFGSTFKMVTS